MAHPKGRSFTTGEAAAYLRQLGVDGCSERSLIRQRLRSQDDPADLGPDFYRKAPGAVVYIKIDLDRYAEQRLDMLVFRGRAEKPKRLRVGDEAA
jgi:hypothetical protein